MGLDLGLERAGLDVVVAVECNRYAAATIKANRPDLPLIERRIETVATAEILKQAGLKRGEAFAVAGGPSCQVFSTAGKRGSLGDVRGTMFEHFVRVVDEARPRFFVLENVRGLLSAAIRHRPLRQRGPGFPSLEEDEELGSAFKVVAAKLRTLGYYCVFDVLNSADYGVPQERHRLVIIGSRDGESMRNPRDATVERTRDGQIAIRLGAESSLRQLERSLRSAGVAVDVFPSQRMVTVGEVDLVRALGALHEWTVVLGPGVEKLRGDMAHGDLWLARARAQVHRLNGDPDAAHEILRDYPSVGVLDPHQVTAVAAASHPDVLGLCIFDEQGLGKTIEALFAFDRLRQMGRVTTALVLAPKNMVLEWARDADRFFPGRYVVQPVSGTQHEKRSQLDRPADIYVTNFETAASLTVRLRGLLEDARRNWLLVVDESFFVKNSDAKRALAVRALRPHVERCIVLCGTPAPNSARDLVEQFNIADGGVAFRGVDVPDDKEAAREVVERVIAERGVYIRRLKGEVLQLPDRTFNHVIVRFAPIQRQAYAAALESLVSDVSAASEVEFRKALTSFMARRIALLQICSNPASVLETYDETPAKLLALDDILAEVITKRGEKVVLWSFFTKSLDQMFNRYSSYNPVRVDGSISDTGQRREAVRRFQEDDQTMLFVANPAAAGAGITLHRARYAIYESMSNQAAHYLQSLDRIHRRGQTRAVEYLMLLCDESIELAEYDRLLRKERESQALLGDHIEPPATKQSFLAELRNAAQLFSSGQ